MVAWPRARAFGSVLVLGTQALVACSDTPDGDGDPYLLDSVSAVTVSPRAEPSGADGDTAAGGSGAGGSGAGAASGAGAGGEAGSGGAPVVEGSGGSAGGSARQYCDAVQQVFVPRCGGGSCHNRPDAAFADFAIGPEEAASFVDVPSVRNAACGLIIDSADPPQSLIYRKLTGDFPAPMCGGFMPVSGGDLTQQQLDCVADWVEQFRR